MRYRQHIHAFRNAICINNYKERFFCGLSSSRAAWRRSLIPVRKLSSNRLQYRTSTAKNSVACRPGLGLGLVGTSVSNRSFSKPSSWREFIWVAKDAGVHLHTWASMYSEWAKRSFAPAATCFRASIAYDSTVDCTDRGGWVQFS